MSEEVLRSMYSAFSRLAPSGDLAAYVGTHWAPGCEYFPVEEGEAIRGRDALLEWHRRWFEPWNALHAEPEEIRESGEAFLVRVHVRGRVAGSEMEVRQRFFHLVEMRDAQIAVMREFLEEEEALEAAGLSE